MIRSMLAAIDGSPSSLAALHVAAVWDAKLGAGLHTVFVEDEQRLVTYSAITGMGDSYVFPVPLPPDQLAAEEKRIAADRSAVEAAYRKETADYGAKSTFESLRGSLNSILVHQAKSADLVAVGRRGKFETMLERRVGPTTETVIYDAVRPVLVVPDKPRTEGPFLIAFDDSRGVQRVLPSALELAERLKAEVVVLTVDDDLARARARQATIQKLVANHGLAAKYLTERGKAAEVIPEIAGRQKAGLIAMGAFGHNPIYELFFGSVARSVMERSACPVLLMT